MLMGQTTPEQPRREMLAAFEAGVLALVEQGKLPDAAKLAAETGSSTDEAASWLQEYRRDDLAEFEWRQKERDSRGINARAKIDAAKAALQAAQDKLREILQAHGVRNPDLNAEDQFLSP